MTPEPYQYEFHNYKDSQLWNALRQGDVKAFEFLYQRHVQSLFDYGMHIEPDADLVKDAIQELFIHLWQRRYSLGEVKNVRNYLIVSIRRGIVAQVEVRKKWQSPALRHIQHLVEVDASPETHMIADEVFLQQENDLTAAIEKLPPRQREVIYLLFFKRFPQKEVANMMSINLASVYTLTSKAIKSLRKYLK
uniref:Sigma-70 family RNA polymerase sigma factor n=1 Tax=Roseihalotalea indica TaxID=2867963 RepID=A0AA49GPD6_9BACT|nr:sigma-70 family RNA polymerase sigma factor [Tunicatimonas sp. TK19036]